MASDPAASPLLPVSSETDCEKQQTSYAADGDVDAVHDMTVGGPRFRNSSCATSLYRRWHLDYLSTALLGLIAVAWAVGLGCNDAGHTAAVRTRLSDVEIDHWGYEGPTPTGKEPMAAATSYPQMFDQSPLNPPSELETKNFEILHNLGNLSPWRTVGHGLDATAQVPAQCKVEQVQLLHRHGARYPTTGAGPAEFAAKLASNTHFKASGQLESLNTWTYKLGAEILTPFGREQLFNLGTSFRVKYGKLLDSPGLYEAPASTTKPRRRKPVFRTETQDRMLKSALNFAAGFFGIPFEHQYHQLVTIEWPQFNNTLSPYMTCTNANRRDLTVGPAKMRKWISIYLAPALERFSKLVQGIDLNLIDVYNMQQMCAYELVALGGSEFCTLFTRDEWRGFEYSLDLQFYYTYSFGQPAQAALGLGWVQEWLSRATGQRLTEFNSTTNATYHAPELFPLDQALYVDATHDTIISAVLTTLRFDSFAKSGPLPDDRVPDDLSFVTSKISPFAANLHSQIVTCEPGDSDDHAVRGKRKVRWILNDGVVPLDHLPGCGSDPQGWCDLDTFVNLTREYTSSIDWAYDCLYPYELGDEPIRDGRPPTRPDKTRAATGA